MTSEAWRDKVATAMGEAVDGFFSSRNRRRDRFCSSRAPGR